MIKMIVTDIDGTLINDNGIITDTTKNALIKAQKNGIRLVLATGRSPLFCKKEQDLLHMSEFSSNYIIAFNGQEIYSFSSNTSVYGKQIPASHVNALLKLAYDYDLEAVCYSHNAKYHYQPPDFLIKKETYLKKHPDLPAKDFESVQGISIPISAWNQPFTHDISKTAFLHSSLRLQEILPRIKEKIPTGLQAHLVKPTWLEVYPKEVSKGGALLHIMKKEGIEKDEVLAFGDGENDLSLLTSVTYGFAMGNAFSTVKEAAYGVTASNNDDGIAQITEDFCFL